MGAALVHTSHCFLKPHPRPSQSNMAEAQVATAAPAVPAQVLGYKTIEGEAIAATEAPVVMPATQVVYYSAPAQTAAYAAMPSPYVLPAFTPESPLTQPCTFKFVVEENKEEDKDAEDAEKVVVAKKTKRGCC